MNTNALWLMVSPLFSTAYAFGLSGVYSYSDFEDTTDSLFHILQCPLTMGKLGDVVTLGLVFI